MSRKQTSIERRSQIIDGALKVFATKGFQEATNRDIAQAAGINSPGLIYHYFEDKKALFMAVLQERSPALQLAIHEAEALFVQPPRAVLTLMASTILNSMTDPTTLSLIRLVLGESLRQSDVGKMLYQGGSIYILDFLYQYFAQLMAQGKMRQIDPGSAVRCFMGPFFTYMITTMLLNVPDPKAPDINTLVETSVDIFLSGTMIYRKCSV